MYTYCIRIQLKTSLERGRSPSINVEEEIEERHWRTIAAAVTAVVDMYSTFRLDLPTWYSVLLRTNTYVRSPPDNNK